MPATLGLVEATTSWTVETGFFRTRRHNEGYVFQDWTVDGVPLRKLLHVRNLGGLQQEMSYLTEGSEEAVGQIDRLLARSPADFNDGRVALLVCPVDWDLNCGAISAEIVVSQGTIEWRNLGRQRIYDPQVQLTYPPLSLVFDRLSYEDVLLSAREQYPKQQGDARSNRCGGAS